MNHEQFFYSKSKILKEILESYDDIRIAHTLNRYALSMIAKKQDEHRTSFFRINHPPDKILLYILCIV
jgi:hypothetical protein